MKTWFRTLAVALGAAATAFLAVVALGQSDEDVAAKGQALVKANCARCHAIGMDDQSPHKSAPAFRELMTRYPAGDLAEALAEGIVSGHPEMPEFVFEPDEIDQIIVYLDTLAPDAASTDLQKN